MTAFRGAGVYTAGYPPAGFFSAFFTIAGGAPEGFPEVPKQEQA